MPGRVGNLEQRIISAIRDATGTAAEPAGQRTVSGGSINDSRLLRLRDGRELFVKTHAHAHRYPGMFGAEFEALSLLAAAGAIRIPRPLAWDEDFIVLEAFRAGTAAPDWHESLGRQLALLHQNTVHGRFGFHRDNYLGTTRQPNAWARDWPGFWREQRLGWQLRLYERGAAADDPLLRLGGRLLDRVDELLGGVEEPPVLLHGDLWSGNAAADESGAPIIFDPASYYGQREAELGMMRLFGGFGPRCEAAYAEVWPLQPGADRRITLYRLYHELNHLNLFGAGYYAGCLATLRELL